MRKLTVALMVAVVLMPLQTFAGITLDYCLDKAQENYPLIKKYGLVEKTADLTLSDINKGWLPRIGVSAQTTVQNVVPEFPESLREVLSRLGQDAKGLGHIQYKAGVDVSQTIWDGGASKAQRAVERAALVEQQSAIAVQMYTVREKVMNLYFGILLMQEQIAQTENAISLLEANLQLMESMKRGGVAMQSDVDMIEAQLLAMKQQLTAARSAANASRSVLAVYVGESLEDRILEKPAAAMPDTLESRRPELDMFRAQSQLNDKHCAAVESTLMPRIAFFAQGWYGYPGINYFESMLNRKPSFNLLAGVKVSWNIDSFYTRKNSHRKFALTNESIANEREVFLYNMRLQTSEQTEEIAGMRKVMADDDRIVTLRAGVRKAAESQLANGVIDATALLTKITDENQARLAASYHEIQLLQTIYKLKNTLNR